MMRDALNVFEDQKQKAKQVEVEKEEKRRQSFVERNEEDPDGFELVDDFRQRSPSINDNFNEEDNSQIDPHDSSAIFDEIDQDDDFMLALEQSLLKDSDSEKSIGSVELGQDLV